MLLDDNTAQLQWTPKAAEAGQFGTWTMTVENIAMEAGTELRIELGHDRHAKTNWGLPQKDDPSGANFVQAYINDRLLAPQWIKVSGGISGRLLHISVPHAVSHGDRVSIVFGDRSQGSPGMQAQTFSQPEKAIAVYREAPGDSGAADTVLLGVLQIDVIGSRWDHWALTGPSDVVRGGELQLHLRPEDVYGNVGQLEDTTLKASITLHSWSGRKLEKVVRRTVEAEKDPWGLFSLQPLHVDLSPGYYFVTMEAEGFPHSEGHRGPHGLQGPCLPIRVHHDNTSTRTYWGYIHGHGKNSDGLGTPDDYFGFIRFSSRLDFGALTEHDHLWETSDSMWYEGYDAAERWNEDGQFVTFPAYEWAKWRRNGDGDRCVYFPSRSAAAIIRSDDGHADTPQKLFSALRPRKAMVIPHHTSMSGNPCDWKDHDDAAERLVEIYGNWGCSERSYADGNPFPVKPTWPEYASCANPQPDMAEAPEGFVQRALAMGLRLGFTAGGDDHKGHPGDNSVSVLSFGHWHYKAGLLAVGAEARSRDSLWKGLYDRATYGTTGERMLISFSVNEDPMGAELSAADDVQLLQRRTVAAAAAGTHCIAAVELLRNNEVVWRREPNTIFWETVWEDDESLDRLWMRSRDGSDFIFYYLRVIQCDGAMAWVSPIWISRQ